MDIGVFVDAQAVDDVVDRVRSIKEQGFTSAWVPQVFGLDALTALAVVGREVPGFPLGTAVVPTYPRHPLVLAQQAITTQSATGGQLTLGIGLSHQMVVENMWGYSFDKPVRHMREYLSVLLPMMREGSVSFQGETIKAMGQLGVKGVEAPPVLIAALGAQMLKLAGSVADGTITWMTGPATVGNHIKPTITTAASDAGKPAPRIVVGLPIALTTDEQVAREKAAKVFSIYGQLPSYRAMLDKEGASGPADVAIVGNEATLASAIENLREQGTTTFMAAPFHEPKATLDFLASL